MIQIPAESLPSAAKGCWLVCFCRAALQHFKEFPNLCSLERIKPMAGESKRGCGKRGCGRASAPSWPLRPPAALLSPHRWTNGALHEQNRCSRQGSAASFTHRHRHLGTSSPGRAQLCPCWGEDALPSALCCRRPGGRASVATGTRDAGGRVPSLIPGLVLIHRLAALLELVRLPHPAGFSHLLLFAFLIFSPIFSPMPNSSPSS